MLVSRVVLVVYCALDCVYWLLATHWVRFQTLHSSTPRPLGATIPGFFSALFMRAREGPVHALRPHA